MFPSATVPVTYLCSCDYDDVENTKDEGHHKYHLSKTKIMNKNSIVTWAITNNTIKIRAKTNKTKRTRAINNHAIRTMAITTNIIKTQAITNRTINTWT